jgi:DNA polymerase I-like protein with 3'-5' exonuclease and polymerase domains
MSLVRNIGTITEIGFATSASRGINIPFWSRSRVNYWRTQAEERAAWEWVRRILAEKDTVWQNGQYDMQYLWRTMGIPTPRFFGDTMILHHSLQPEMKKGLGFLASIYTDEPSWKFMRTDHSTLKREDD